MGVSLKDCYDSRPIDFTWSTLRDYTGPNGVTLRGGLALCGSE